MVSAIVLLVIERDKINEVAETLTAVKGISEVFSVLLILVYVNLSSKYVNF